MVSSSLVMIDSGSEPLIYDVLIDVNPSLVEELRMSVVRDEEEKEHQEIGSGGGGRVSYAGWSRKVSYKVAFEQHL